MYVSVGTTNVYLEVETFQFNAGEVVASKGGTRQSASVNDSAVAETTIRASNHTPLNAQSENEYLQMCIANFVVWNNFSNHTCTQRTPDRRHTKFEFRLNHCCSLKSSCMSILPAPQYPHCMSLLRTYLSS